MAAYYMNELAFELPDMGFVDRTIYDLDGQLPNGDVLGVLVVREPIAPGKSLREAVDEHLLREAKRLGGYAVLGDREATIGGAPAIEVCTRWRHGRGAYYTREAHLDHAGATGTRARLLITMTTPLHAKGACDEHVDHLLSTLRLRDFD